MDIFYFFLDFKKELLGIKKSRWGIAVGRLRFFFYFFKKKKSSPETFFFWKEESLFFKKNEMI